MMSRPMTQARIVMMAALSLTFAALSTAFGAEAPKGLATVRMEGKIGPYPVGVNLLVRDYVQFAEGHYFYANKLLDIRLDGRVEGENVTLEEPGGGAFHLHFVSNDSAKGQSLNFYNSTGLQGVWTKGDKTLPVTLGFSTVYDGPARTRWYADVTNESDAVFEARVRKFLRAVIADDKGAAAGLVSYPLRVNGPRSLVIRSKADLAARWEQIFTPALKARLRDAIPHEMFVHNGDAMVGDGVVWFDAKGASAINP